MFGKIEFMHFRDDSGDVRGGCTVAISHDPSNQVAIFSLAYCNRTDVFNKKIGRSIASGRLAAFMNGRQSMIDRVHVIQDVPSDQGIKTLVATELAEELAELHYY